MQFSKNSKILAAVYGVIAVGWMLFIVAGRDYPWIGDYFQIPFLLIPALGAVFLFRKANTVGRNTRLGQVISVYAISLTCWASGWLANTIDFIVYQRISPYPGYADFFYIIAWVFWAVGLALMARMLRPSMIPTAVRRRLWLLVFPLGLFVLTEFLILRAGDIQVVQDLFNATVAVDFIYTSIDVLALTLCVLCFAAAARFIGSQVSTMIGALSVGFLLVYISDLGFTYTMASEIFFNGNFTDFGYNTALFLIAFAILNLDQGLGADAFEPAQTPEEFHAFTKRVMCSMQDLRIEMNEILHNLAKQMRVGKISVFLQNEATMDYEVLYSLTDEDKMISRKDPLVLALRAQPQILIWEDVLKAQKSTPSPGRQEELQEVINSFLHLRLGLVAPMPTDHNFRAILAIGPKLLANSFDSRDTKLVAQISEDLAVMIENKYQYDSAMGRVVVNGNIEG